MQVRACACICMEVRVGGKTSEGMEQSARQRIADGAWGGEATQDPVHRRIAAGQDR